jgi:hypothetical protein
MAVLVGLVIFGMAIPLYAAGENEYDPEKILQVPHQPILNNETLPGTTGNTITVQYDHRGEAGIYPESLQYKPPGTRVEFITEARPDIYPVYSSYTKVELSRRLQEIRVYGSGTKAHRYALSYGTSGHSGRSLLAGVREYGSGGIGNDLFCRHKR